MFISSFFSSKKIHHLAYVVKKFETSPYGTLVAHLGAELESSGEVLSEGVMVHMIKLSKEGPLLEILSPLEAFSDKSAKINKFISRKGEGFHHVCYATNDLLLDQKKLAENNISFLEGYPKLGYQDKLIAFIDPKQTDGLLIELKEVT